MTKIDKSQLTYGIEQRFEDRKYLDSLYHRPCIVTGYQYVEGAEEGVDPAHIRTGWHGQTKPHDFYAVPLRHSEHLAQSEMPEREYWDEIFIIQCRDLITRTLKSHAVLMYLKYSLGDPDMSDRELVRKVTGK